MDTRGLDLGLVSVFHYFSREGMTNSWGIAEKTSKKVSEEVMQLRGKENSREKEL